jgi:ABC-type uncharacterized transport system YnjBCD ATPase subunit
LVVDAVAVRAPLSGAVRNAIRLERVPIRMDNARLKSVLGKEPYTPLDIALRNTLVGLGCLAAS